MKFILILQYIPKQNYAIYNSQFNGQYVYASRACNLSIFRCEIPLNKPVHSRDNKSLWTRRETYEYRTRSTKD